MPSSLHMFTSNSIIFLVSIFNLQRASNSHLRPNCRTRGLQFSWFRGSDSCSRYKAIDVQGVGSSLRPQRQPWRLVGGSLRLDVLAASCRSILRAHSCTTDTVRMSRLCGDLYCKFKQISTDMALDKLVGHSAQMTTKLGHSVLAPHFYSDNYRLFPAMRTSSMSHVITC